MTSKTVLSQELSRGKAPEGETVFRLDWYRCFATEVNQCIDARLLAVEKSFDTAVVAIAHPAANIKT